MVPAIVPATLPGVVPPRINANLMEFTPNHPPGQKNKFQKIKMCKSLI